MATATDAVAARFKSIKSLPVDYRFMGSLGEKYANSLVSVSVPENGNMDRVVDDDSSYGKGSSYLLNDRPSVVDVNDDDNDVNPSVSAQGSILGSWGNKKCGYTASYFAKKLNLVFKLHFSCCMNVQ
ncbi:hypothetical protein HanPI659440_Chr11g0409041 [Helianthus annuus]|nr:hypothetical protein HanPI659440_Chr11g0409041 [Helianthus annuus]